MFYATPAGSVSQTSAPPPARFDAARVPPCASAISCTIESPRPDPPSPRASSARLNRSNARSRNASSNPGPGRRRAGRRRRSLVLRRRSHLAGAVAERVLDEIVERLFEAVRVGSRSRRSSARRASARPDSARASRSASRPSRSTAATSMRSLPDRERAVLGTSEQQQVVGERDRRSVSTSAERSASCSSSGARGRRSASSSSVRRSGNWRAQLVARVSDESPLVLERRLQPREHLVERHREP